MIKLNNKGFAISTLLYGLILMMFLIVLALMSVLGSTRKNTKNLVDTIDQELKAIDNEHAGFIYDGDQKDFRYTVPTSGWYKLELIEPAWNYHNVTMTHGNYVSGFVYLEAQKDLYVHIGLSNPGGHDDTYVRYEGEDASKIFMRTSNQEAGIDIPLAMGYAGLEVDDELWTMEGSKPIVYNMQTFLAVSDDWRGQVKINKVSDNSPVDLPVAKEANSGLDQVRYIKDCTTGSSAGATSAWTEIQAIDTNGVNVAKGKSVTASGGNQPGGKIAAVTDGLITKQDSNHFYSDNNKNDENAEKCVTVDLESPQNLNEVAVWHYYSDGRTYKNHKLQVGPSLDNLTTLRQTSYTSYQAGPSTQVIDTNEPENLMGTRYTRFSPNPSLDNLANGTYYIVYSGDTPKNQVLTNENNKIKNNLFYSNESNILQQWSITRREDGTYRIVNISNNSALERSGNNLIYSNSGDNDNQKWNINPNPAGYYIILIPSTGGPPYAITSAGVISQIGGGYNNARFKFIRVQ